MMNIHCAYIVSTCIYMNEYLVLAVHISVPSQELLDFLNVTIVTCLKEALCVNMVITVL